jgi:hypothetical protein
MVMSELANDMAPQTYDVICLTAAYSQLVMGICYVLQFSRQINDFA